MAVSNRLRYEILRRDNHTCRYCHAIDTPLTIDHVVPTALGGTDDPGNLVAACKDCNAGKSASSPDAPLVDDVAQDALRWAHAMKVSMLAERFARVERDSYRSQFKESWDRWTYLGADQQRHAIDLPIDWPLTVDRFISAGLHITDLLDCIDNTMRTYGVKDEFRYFCGTAWNLVAQRQVEARDYLAYQEQNGEVS